MRKSLPVTWVGRHSGFLHHLQLASHNIAAILLKK